MKMRTNRHWSKEFMKLLRSKIIVGGPDDCWPWTGSVVNGSKPYGRVRVEGKLKLVHRVIYELYTGEELSDDIQVCHSCDNPICCNPHHLWTGTNEDNMLDKMVKRRASHEGPPGKFTYNEWQEIKRLFYVENLSKCEIAKRFNTYDTTIRRVLNAGDNYKCKENSNE
uniref:Putative homing endonuclease n=1 Tax=viral metagenome TaxID=1070528 RepID=A0A6M3JQT0_9ZZZZ